MPRMLTAIVMLLALTLSGFTAPLVAAQEATPAAGKDRLLTDTMGLPELAITATADAYEGVPAETAAGRYVVTLTSTGGADASAGVEFRMLPEDVSFADFQAMMTESMEGPPEWYYQTYHAGGLVTDPDSTSQGIFDLRPGTYVVWSGGDPEAPQPPVEMAVTGEAATPAVTAGAEPAAGATVTMFEYGFKVDGQLMPGPQLLKVANVGAQPHFMVMIQPNEPVTKEQVRMLLEAEMAGTPTADAAAAAGVVSNPDEWGFAEFAGTISMGASEWIATDLDPGTYVLVCFVPDIESGIPHAYLGMADVVTVGDGGTPTP
jgi:hypothetical protein